MLSKLLAKHLWNYKTKKIQSIVFISAIALTIIFGSLFTYLSYQFWHNEKLIEQNAYSLASKQSESIANKIDEGFEKLRTATKTTAEKLTKGELPYKDFKPYAEKELKEYQSLFGISLGFKPYKYNINKKLYAPYIIKTSGDEFKFIQIAKIYDYTIPKTNNTNSPNTDWYIKPIESNSSMWLPPYYGKASKKIIVEYVAPFYLSDAPHTIENQIGVAVYTISLANLNRYVASMILGDTSYAYIVSQDDIVLAHPVHEHIGGHAMQKFTSTNTGHLEHYNPKTGKSFWIFIIPLKTTGWKIYINLDKEDFLIAPKIKMRHVSWMILTGILTILFFLAIVSQAYKGDNFGLWSFSFSSSLLFLIGIALLWYFFLYFSEPISGTKITDKAALNRYLLLHGTINKTLPITYIPTGVFIQSMYFPSQNRVGISGYIWQKYPKGKDISTPQGFLLQHQVGLTSIQEVSRQTVGSKTIALWHFDTNIRQSMDPFVYPLDKENISLKLWHKDFMKNILLVPDLEGYETLNPKLLPGLSDELFLEDWVVKKSFFSYKTHHYQSYFGINPSRINPKVPELYFNISVARNVMNSIFSYIIPLFLVTAMLFAISMSSETAHIISYAGAMLIVITVAHVALRNRIAVQGISYLETFYIVVYPIIVAVTISFLLHKSKTKFAILEFRNNLITKLLYWPVILGINFFIALAFFGFN